MASKLDCLVEQYNKVMALYGQNRISETGEQVKIMLELAGEIENHYYYAVGLNFLGALQTAQGNESRALDFYFEAMIYAEKYQVTEFLPVVYNNIGARYMDAGVHDEAIVYLKKAEEILEVQEPTERVSETVNNNRKVINYMNLALSYTYIRQYKESNRYLEKSRPFIAGSNLDLDFTYSLILCQNSYYLGDTAYVKASLDELVRGIRELDNPYNYQNNIKDMFSFLDELGEQGKMGELLDIVEQFAHAHNDPKCERLACELRTDYEKRYGSQEAYQESCVELTRLYKEQEREAVEQRREYMTLRLEMRRAESERNDAEKAQQKILADALENAKKASVAKSQFLSGMSHELRTPLNAVIGYLSIAKESRDDLDKLNHCIENGDIAARQLLQIVNDVLDMSSIESGRMKIAYEEFDLKQELKEITTIFYQNARAKGIRFDAQIDHLMQEWVIGDQLRLKQVLMNLLSNAIKFTPESGLVKLVIRQLTPDVESKDCFIQFEVSDTGIGMSREYLGRIFNPFEQEHANTARKYGGSGLGLSITHNLINMMGGTIEVKSRQGEGTTFVIILPFTKSIEHPVRSYKKADFAHIRALIVDDQKEDAAYIRTMLKHCGLKADMVTSGREALKRIESRMGGDYAYDLCILDWNMPEMDGVETAARIRAQYGDAMPIVIATAYDVTEFEAEARTAGVNKIVAKPLFQSTLFDLLVDTFGGYDPAAEKEEDGRQLDLSDVCLLLAEDNAMNMDIAVTILKKAGIRVETAENGQIAVDKFLAAEAGTFDMILMDVQMPVMDGYEATQAIRNSGHQEARTIPIIAMTANAFAEDVAEALSKGMDAHIAKPVNYDKLFALLKRYRKKK